MIELNKINEIIEKIKERFNPDKIILFGSYANGTANEDSDLDLLIVKDTEMPRHKRNIEIRKSLIGSKMPMDILVYTKEEFEYEKKDMFSFVSKIFPTSKIVYER